MGEISLTVDEAALLAMLLLVESQFLPFDAGEGVFVGAKVSDVCDDAGVFELNKCVVDDKAGEVVGWKIRRSVSAVVMGVKDGSGNARAWRGLRCSTSFLPRVPRW